MALPGSVGEDKYKSAPDAKHLLDEIGEVVYKQVKKEADGTNYINELKGNLASSSILGETAGTDKPCDFEYDKLINGSGSGGAARGDPCKKDGKGEEVPRFSDKQGAECTKSKIKDSEKDGVGACAPLRRLHLCNKNMVKMDTNNYSKAKHNLLLDVCMAANYEAQSLKTYREQYDSKYPGSGHTTCTMLARSFADIGDIVRGKDLYSGNNKEKNRREKLEGKLKNIFQQIHDDVTNGKNVDALKTRYEGDEANNFFKLREDWWTANRETIWKAMTCSDELTGASYFHATCDGGDNRGGAQANDKCRCKDKKGQHDTDQVPTYFDYVPQYLRWFEEWAEDFCRKKKKKIKDVQKQCRGKYKL